MRCKKIKCCEEIKQLNFYVAFVLEGLGVAFLVFITGNVVTKVDVKKDIFVVESSIVIGFTLAVLTQCIKDVSGAHLNPAITIASLCTSRVSLIRCLFYLIFQCGGGMAITSLQKI